MVHRAEEDAKGEHHQFHDEGQEDNGTCKENAKEHEVGYREQGPDALANAYL